MSPIAGRARKLNERVRKQFGRRLVNINAVDLYSVLALHGEECFYCGIELDFDAPGDHSTFDHLVPLGRGGLHHKRNIVPCCYRCNQKKGERAVAYSGGRLRFKVAV